MTSIFPCWSLIMATRDGLIQVEQVDSISSNFLLRLLLLFLPSTHVIFAATVCMLKWNMVWERRITENTSGPFLVTIFVLDGLWSFSRCGVPLQSSHQPLHFGFCWSCGGVSCCWRHHRYTWTTHGCFRGRSQPMWCRLDCWPVSQVNIHLLQTSGVDVFLNWLF